MHFKTKVNLENIFLSQMELQAGVIQNYKNLNKILI